MNSKCNLRFQQTENKIRDVFLELLKKKELSKITVSEICRLSEINRTAFYLHHEDIFHLMQEIETDMYQYFIRLFTVPGENYSLKERYLLLFRFIRERQDFYRVFLSGSNPARLFDHTLLQDPLTGIPDLLQRLNLETPLEYEYMQTFSIAGLTAMIRKWLNGKCRETEEELLSLLSRQFEAGRNIVGF